MSRIVERCRIVKVAGKGESNWSTEETRKKSKKQNKTTKHEFPTANGNITSNRNRKAGTPAKNILPLPKSVRH